MHLRCGGIFKDYFTTHLVQSDCERILKISTFGEVMGKRSVSFFDLQGIGEYSPLNKTKYTKVFKSKEC